MRGYKPERVLCPVRLPKADYDAIKAKVMEDHLTFQKLLELLLLAYLKDDKYIKDLVKVHSDVKNDKKRRFHLDEIEANELLRLIEEEYSPLRSLEKAKEEIKKEKE